MKTASLFLLLLSARAACAAPLPGFDEARAGSRIEAIGGLASRTRRLRESAAALKARVEEFGRDASRHPMDPDCDDLRYYRAARVKAERLSDDVKDLHGWTQMELDALEWLSVRASRDEAFVSTARRLLIESTWLELELGRLKSAAGLARLDIERAGFSYDAGTYEVEARETEAAAKKLRALAAALLPKGA
jgi:hypothetical protein